MTGWSNYEVMAREEYQDIFSFPTQLPSLDFSGFSANLEFQNHLPTQDSAFEPLPLMEMFLYDDPLYSSLNLEPIQTQIPENFFCGNGSSLTGFETWNPQLLLENTNEEITAEEPAQEEKRVKRQREMKNNASNCNILSRDTISQYFYMPITQAAKELNVGLTLLKKRCRELGIRRWPHRKLMSLRTLIKNVQELGQEEGEGKLRDAIQILEQERKLMEEMPDIQLEDKTKRLRQACFKVNYKKRKLMAGNSSMMSESKSAGPSGDNPAAAIEMNVLDCGGCRDDEDVDDGGEMQSFLSNCFSSSSDTVFSGVMIK
ncbi:Hypothetical predicted protein [Olea europaea subsp. europaea]|uniref:RWP-RK domain-containing protein n=1 Tax=Olea europaea subsp. europaea TaxID=158383 RepID=A0A8S0PE04_OLEEU|nr:Hypothetical predicted protein [Olea europaea subsp. europaea]